MINSTKNTACNQYKGIFFLNLKSAHSGRFFVCSFLVSFLVTLLFSTTAQSADETLCHIASADETVEIKQVIDGDTVILKDGRHVRLIGIDTPEIGRKGEPSDAGAESARKNLISLLQGQKKVLLKYDSERHDRYQRTLAHLFLANGQNIQASLLAAGLATPLNIPPNLRFIDCYLYHADQAMASQQGLWTLQNYQAIRTADLGRMPTLDKAGRHYRQVNGKVERVTESRTSIWINLENNVALRIRREDLPYFNETELQRLPGKIIQARGRLYKTNKQYRINIRHPSDMMLLE